VEERFLSLSREGREGGPFLSLFFSDRRRSFLAYSYPIGEEEDVVFFSFVY